MDGVKRNQNGQNYVWSLRSSEHHRLPAATDNNFVSAYLTVREEDMRSCGMEAVSGYSNDIEPSLCLEKKGWYL